MSDAGPPATPRITAAGPAAAGAGPGSGVRPSVSICLATFDGARYLPALLESLLAQSEPPDQIVACDDASGDATPALLEHFAASSPVPTRVVGQPVRVGIAANFDRALREASGDVLLICDQDDVWHADKVATLRSLFAERPALLAAFHDSRLVDAAGADLRRTLWEATRLAGRRRARLAGDGAFAELVAHPRVVGHSLAISATLRDLVLPIPAEAPYDLWLVRLAAAAGPIAPLERALVSHRLHAASAVGLPSSLSLGARLGRLEREREAYRREAAGLAALERRLAERLPEALDGTARRLIGAKSRHVLRRAELSRAARPAGLALVAGELAAGRYHRFSNGLASAALDAASIVLARREPGQPEPAGQPEARGVGV